MTTADLRAEAYIPGGHTSDDLRDRAARILPPALLAHLVGGAGEERTMAANRAGFGCYRLLPRVLTDVRSIDTRVTVLGTELAAPVFVSPTGGIGDVHAEGELGLVRAAAASGVAFTLSGAAGVTIEDAAAAAGAARWCQVYWQGNRAVMADLADRAERAGYRALVLTVDNAVRARRRRMLLGGHSMPASAATANLQRYVSNEWQALIERNEAERVAAGEDPDMPLVWESVRWFRSIVRLPFVLKGIMSAADATRAIEIGADGVIISNHGGRNLDGEPGTIEVLESIRKAVGDEPVVMLDGGVRSASDIAIALGLGASAVGLGSPVLWALACGGQATVTNFLDDLVADLARTMGMLGAASVGELRRDHVSARNEFIPDWALARYLPPPYSVSTERGDPASVP